MKLNVIGPLNNLGYGIHTTNMCKALNKLGVEGIQSSTIFKDLQNVDIINSFNNVKDSPKLEFNKEVPNLFIYYANLINMNNDYINYNFVVFETDVIHPSVVNSINIYSNLVLTTNIEHKQILIDNNVT